MRPEFTWRLAREAWPFVLPPALVAIMLAAVGLLAWAIAVGVLALLVAAFFRDPRRQVPDLPGIALSPADGRVVRIADRGPEGGPTVSVFLSVFNVHVNRTPIGGTVRAVTRTRGRFRAAFLDAASTENERVAMTVDGAPGIVTCTQIAGLVARRIVCRTAPGDHLEAGERYGLIRFGSRVDIALPSGAVPLVELGDRVRGGVTPIAKLTGLEAT